MNNLKINRHRQQVQCFEEKLSETVKLSMMLIPAGTFTMGSPASEPESQDSERPQHSVTIQTFFMGKYPVTQAQWKIVAGFPKANRDLNPDPSNFKGEDRPVECVSWLDAVEFCNRLAKYTQRPYRLPSESEWEYACRAATRTPFHFGETITTDLANYYGIDNSELNWSGSYGIGPKGIYREKTTSVGSFCVANAFGLYDMHGNVWEWCRDHWHESYGSSPALRSAWLDNRDEMDGDTLRVLRGGSWFSNPVLCRSASRFCLNAGYALGYVGFRVVCSVARTL